MANTKETVALTIVALCLITIAEESHGRELRPSDHGLVYQDSPPAGKKSPEMMTFFGVGEGSPPAMDVPLPRAMNSTEPSPSAWLGGGGESKDRVRQVLLIGSLVCGVTGVALLVASGLLYIFRYKKRQRSSPSSSSPRINNDPKPSSGS
ncbi:hypothetical protein FNV43_RR06380 [Rhamnella rubrinervis]|uniref:Uncharacterized protein n=1 Tax=Rhamnella rubrinervis TaxID=2594499 RepID=A0A8K0HEF4_9ROSA|nr:hypothetical protein FNV43_RR06380 [Rhamnella rubrinervis]